jgi:hypothetical protein
MAQYKTIALTLIQDCPERYERLRSTKRPLTAMDAYALDLKNSHERWKEEIARKRPGSDPSQISSEALELAIEDLRHSLSASGASGEESPPLEPAMTFIRRHTPPA